MNRARVRRLAAVLSAAVVGTSMFTGVASAAPANWVMDVTKLPASVSPGAPAGYKVEITNNGPSNVAALYLVAEVNGSVTAPTVYVFPSQGACDPVGQPLDCTLGALNASQTATVVVAFATPISGSTFPVEFQGNATGNTFKDGIKGRSHGDTLLPDPVVTTTALNNNKNFAGFFSTDAVEGIGNSDVLTGSNKQSTRLEGLAPGFLGTVEDGPTTTGSCTNDPALGINCSQLSGEWSVINVANGGAVPGGFFVIIHYKQSGTPTAFLHSFGSPVVQQLIGPCAATPVAPCFAWDATTLTATLFLEHNGSVIKR